MADGGAPRLIDAQLGVTLSSHIPTLLAHDSRLLLAFSGRSSTDGGDRHVIAEARGLLQVKYGYPNDEAINGHPLFQYGLMTYAAFEVLNSPWLAEIDAANRVAFPEWGTFQERHFILPFKELTVELLCSSLKAYPAQPDSLAEFVRLAGAWAGER